MQVDVVDGVDERLDGVLVLVADLLPDSRIGGSVLGDLGEGGAERLTVGGYVRIGRAAGGGGRTLLSQGGEQADLVQDGISSGGRKKCNRRTGQSVRRSQHL